LLLVVVVDCGMLDVVVVVAILSSLHLIDHSID